MGESGEGFHFLKTSILMPRGLVKGGLGVLGLTWHVMMVCHMFSTKKIGQYKYVIYFQDG